MNTGSVRRRHLAVAVAAGAVMLAVAAGGSVAAAAAPPQNTSQPRISGQMVRGSTLTADPGRWTNSPTSFVYQWLRCDANGVNCASIAGATGRRYTLVSRDVGHRMKVRVTAINSSGSASALSDATPVIRNVATAPRASSRPAISGTTQEGQTLTSSTGSWAGTKPMTFSYQWLRCDTAGANCAAIAGATGAGYTLTAVDVAHTMRVEVTAHNAAGSATSQSDASGLVTPARAGGAAIDVSQVSLPNRLVVDQVKFSPQPLRTRRVLTGRFHVTDTRGFSIRGALVYALGLPYGWVRPAPEVPTNDSGWATIVFAPTRALPLRPGTSLVVFVRARKAGENLLAGVSTRRLVQATVR